jgi:HSP20 family protein
MSLLTRMMHDVSPLVRLQGDMNRLFESFFDDMPAMRPYGGAFPAINLWEDGETAHLECELPGLTLNDIELNVTGDQVQITGERKIADQPEASWHRRERSYGKFTRSVTLPWEIDADKVEAHLHEGILSIKLPKCESCKPKKVKVMGD